MYFSESGIAEPRKIPIAPYPPASSSVLSFLLGKLHACCPLQLRAGDFVVGQCLHMVQLEVEVTKGLWRPVVRYDCSHDFAHRDRYHLQGEQEKDDLQLAYAEALNLAIIFLLLTLLVAAPVIYSLMQKLLGLWC